MESTYAQRIARKLHEAFTPIRLEINDDSAQHAGHSGSRPGGETHFSITIVSPVFSGLGRVERHRLVYEVLADELRERVHALSLIATAPDKQQP